MLTAINPNDRTNKSAPLKRNKMAQITKTYAYIQKHMLQARKKNE